MIFRTRNLGTSASPPGTVAILLGDGLEAVDDPEVAVASVAPGEDVVAMMRARIAVPLDDRTELAVQAVLRVPDAALGTNVCAVLVRSRPVLDGAASGTFVEPLDEEHVRVRAVVTNEGDGAACGVRIDVPAPAGCVRLEGDSRGVLEIERLDVGASVTVAFEARIVDPVAVVHVDDAEVCYGAGRRCMLPVREVVVMEPVIAAPCVAVRSSRRSAEVAVDVRNDGWVDARDVRVRIALPAPLRAIDGSIVMDGVPVAAARGGRRGGGDPPFARVERTGGAHVAVVPVFARSTTRVALTATFAGGYLGGTVVASAGPHETAAPFAPELVHDVRIRLIDMPRAVAPGGEIRVAVEVVNAGDVAEELFFCIAGPGIVVAPEAVSRTIAPGCVAVVELVGFAHHAASVNGPLVLSVVACDSERERARAEFAVVVRDRLAPCCGDAIDPDDAALPALVQAALHGPDHVAAGAPFTMRADIDVEDSVEMLAVRVRDVAGATYVSGSTSLDGRLLLDRAGASPLGGAGLLLRSVTAGTRVTAAWTLLADPSVCDEALVVELLLEVDGEERPVESVAVHVRGRDAFVPQPSGLAYHVDACVVEVAPSPEDVIVLDSQPAAPDDAFAAAAVLAVHPPQTCAPYDDAFTFGFRVDPSRLHTVARLLETAGSGLVAHVFALRSFFPDDETSGDPRVAAALDGVRCTLGDVFDRLFVKLRIPGFDVAADDVDDAVLRSAMICLFERLLDASPGDDRGEGATVRMTRGRVHELLAAFADAPHGAPAMLRALVALLPVRCESDPPLGVAIARYARALDDVLARYEGAPLEIFDDALARASDRALDDARVALAAALREPAPLAGMSC
ncbi:MAG: hypothetical protein M3169_06180 [Candidatus Eremiobacteraeota bacterium]|nr:hypothetical protein [Candidatus Eremiobacteraeota bacterium]